MTVAGVDVSNYQGRLDWERVYAGGYRYAWILATDGSSFRDGVLLDDIDGARAAGLKVGGYHFGRPARHAVGVEAAWYLANVPGGLDLPAALDMEEDWLPDADANTDWALAWFDAVDNRRKLIYTNGDGARHHLDSVRLVDAGVELWYAHPGSTSFAGIAAWLTAAVVQTGQGPVPGSVGDVDLNMMSDEVWQAWFGDTQQQAEEESMFATVTDHDGAVWLFGRGTDDRLWWSVNGSPIEPAGEPEGAGGMLTGSPAATVRGDGTIQVVARGTDNGAYALYVSGGGAAPTFDGWHQLGGQWK